MTNYACRVVASTVDQQHEQHVHCLTAQHEQAISDMQTYYNDVVRSNLDVIKALKQRLGEAARTAAGATRAAAAAEAARAALEAPYKEAASEMETLRRAAQGAARDRALQRRTAKQLARAVGALRDKELQLEALQQQHEALQGQYDTLQRCGGQLSPT